MIQIAITTPIRDESEKPGCDRLANGMYGPAAGLEAYDRDRLIAHLRAIAAQASSAKAN